MNGGRSHGCSTLLDPEVVCAVPWQVSIQCDGEDWCYTFSDPEPEYVRFLGEQKNSEGVPSKADAKSEEKLARGRDKSAGSVRSRKASKQASSCGADTKKLDTVTGANTTPKVEAAAPAADSTARCADKDSPNETDLSRKNEDLSSHSASVPVVDRSVFCFF